MSDRKQSCTPEVGEVHIFVVLESFLMVAPKGTYYTVQQIEPERIATMHVVRNENFKDGYPRGSGILFYEDGDICSAGNCDEFRILGIHHATDYLRKHPFI